uniref:EB domain-containing protein n=2 Tax=Trichuris muris TaxID=70415 RepID=A0A5S6Q427_TRIMR
MMISVGSFDLWGGRKPLIKKMSSCPLVLVLVIIILGTTNGCKLHKDCAASEALCYDKYCLLATPLSDKCTTDADCRVLGSFEQNAGRGCRNKQCYEIKADKLCTAHVSCGNDEVCIRNHCVPSVATSSKCLSDVVCGIGRRCLDGLCYEPQESSRILQVINL